MIKSHSDLRAERRKFASKKHVENEALNVVIKSHSDLRAEKRNFAGKFSLNKELKFSQKKENFRKKGKKGKN